MASLALLPGLASLPPHAPIDLLPPELLSLILEHALPPSPPFPSNPAATRDFLRAVSAVCTRWREVLRLTPRLWTCVVYVEQWEKEGGNVPFQLALRRSGALPLDVSVNGAEPVRDVLCNPLFGGVVERIRSLSLAGAKDAFQHLPASAGWPALEQLSVSNVSITFPQLHALLRSSPGLHALHICAVSFPGRTVTDALDLPQLHTLELADLPPSVVRALLSSLAAPSIRAIFLGRNSALDGDILDGRSLLSRLPAGVLRGVQKLTYAGACLSSPEILDALRCVPRVRQLGIVDTACLLVDVEWIAALTSRVRRGELLVPQLEQLGLWNVAPPIRALQELCEARLHAAAALPASHTVDARSDVPKPSALRILELDSVRLVDLYWSERRRLQLTGVDVRCWWPEGHYWQSEPFQAAD
ncbi:hypothetical protein CALVIDRAFT_172321 [Calocera viscosa TUFC12733]|uniref:F-box domain-containing protein n=1 Tax=Calocera viscosa (strain TUFC12733) TaxID=1330018 RepID=A0A167LA33_CALVF|nr:hypothetical protein CALVIDRAFT_172321 [Calocera viscosa TUFC12733]